MLVSHPPSRLNGIVISVLRFSSRNKFDLLFPSSPSSLAGIHDGSQTTGISCENAEEYGSDVSS